MPAKKKTVKKTTKAKQPATSFAKFISDPMIATALIVFALIALVLSIIEFTQALAI